MKSFTIAYAMCDISFTRAAQQSDVDFKRCSFHNVRGNYRSGLSLISNAPELTFLSLFDLIATASNVL